MPKAKNEKFDPHIVIALKYWNELKFKRTPNLQSYEDCATLPLWNNPFITQLNGECFSRKNPITTIEKKTKPRELYHIGSLFTNFDHTQYFNGGAIIAGEFIPNAQLVQKFPNTLESDWNIIKQAVKRSPFYHTIRQGKKPFENGEFVATTTMYRNTIKMHDIYRIKNQIGHEIYLEFWERVENNDWVIEQTNQVGKPNQRTPDGNYPLLKDLFRIHLSPIKNSNTFRVYALQYKKVTKNNFY